jgi:tyrosyl-tRNA synthetase
MPDLLVLSNLAKSKSDARRLIADGGVFVGEEKIVSPNHALDESDLEGDGVIIRKGKKTYCRIRKA